MSKANKDIIEILDRYCSSAIKSNDDKTFFLSIADYVKCVVNNTESNDAIMRILVERNEEYKIRAEYEKKAIEEIEEILKKLKAFAIKYKIKKEEIDNLFSENEKYEQGKMISSQSKADRLFGYAKNIIEFLREGGHEKLVNQYIKTHPDDSKIVISYTISESYDLCIREEELMRYRDDFILGNEWNNLVWVYNTLYNIRELWRVMYDEFDKDKGLLGFPNYIRYKEMARVFEGKKESSDFFFTREKHKKSLIRINNYLSQELLLENNKKISRKEEIDTTIPAEGELIKNIKIYKGERKYCVLVNDKKPFELPIRNADEKNKTRYWDLILSIAENGNVEPDFKTITGILSYFNSSKANPILKVFNVQQLLDISSELIYPHTGIKIEVMKDAIRKKHFKR